jgi:multiple sugar transport system substrate-binding protein
MEGKIMKTTRRTMSTGGARSRTGWKKRRSGAGAVVGVGAALLMATAGVAASAASVTPHRSTGHASSVTITEQDYYTAADSTYMTQFFNGFHKANPGYTVSRDVVPNASLLSKELTEASAGQMPDLMMMDNPWVPSLASAGELMPLSKFGFTSKGLSEGAVAAGTYRGKLYGIGFGNNTIGLFYNKKLLSAAHVTPPRTWAQLAVDAKKLTKNGVYGYGFAAGTNNNAAWQFEPYFWTAGGNLAQVNDAGGVKALSFVSSFVKDGSAPSAVVNWGQNNVAQEFMDGKLAMIVMGPWEFPDFSAVKGLSYGIAPIPTPTATGHATVPLGGEVFTIPKTTPAKEALAAKVLRYLISPQNTLLWAKNNGEVASQRSVAKQLIAAVPLDRVFADEIQHAESRVGIVGTAYPAISSALTTAIQEAVLGKATPSAALTTAETAVKAALAQAKSGS